MAVQLEKPRRPINVVLRTFARQSVQQLQADFRIQHIYPYEIYPGFKRVNEYRKQHKSWHATGEGIKSFQYEVMSSAEGSYTIRIEYLSHLDFVGRGQVPGVKADEVQRGRKARYNKRYVAIWDSRNKDTHRPSILREARHIEARMQSYISDYLGQEMQTYIYRTFAGMHAINLDV